MRKHLALKFVCIVTIVMVIATALSDLSLKNKRDLVFWALFTGGLSAMVILYTKWSARNPPKPLVSAAPGPSVRSFGWGIPIQGPQNGPPCDKCGTRTIVGSSPCVTLYWCDTCKKNFVPLRPAPTH